MKKVVIGFLAVMALTGCSMQKSDSSSEAMDARSSEIGTEATTEEERKAGDAYIIEDGTEVKVDRSSFSKVGDAPWTVGQFKLGDDFVKVEDVTIDMIEAAGYKYDGPDLEKLKFTDTKTYSLNFADSNNNTIELTMYGDKNKLVKNGKTYSVSLSDVSLADPRLKVGMSEDEVSKAIGKPMFSRSLKIGSFASYYTEDMSNYANIQFVRNAGAVYIDVYTPRYTPTTVTTVTKPTRETEVPDEN